MRRVAIASEVERRKVVFGLPDTAAGRVVAELELRWAWVDDVFQAVVWHDGVWYPNCVLATAEEVRVLLDEKGGMV
ncbi:MAG: hypothetical protein IKY92_06000 [Akkermansia sp.]|nr:hypothetical protein [Akkermansia sp.]